MSDKIVQSFLRKQFKEGMALARESDLLELVPNDTDTAPNCYLARFHCKGLVCDNDSSVREATEFAVGIWLPSDYLRRVEPAQVLTWLGPRNIFHPNIRPPHICLGRLPPGTPLVDILHQCFEVITYHNWAAHDGLNLDACQWARNNQHRFPVDRRPLKRRVLDLQCGPNGNRQQEVSEPIPIVVREKPGRAEQP